MDKEILEKIERNNCKLLEEYAEKGYHSPADVQTVKNLLSAMVKIKASRAMDEYENNSSGYYYDNEGGSFRRRHRSYDNDDNSSHRRGYYDNDSSGYRRSYDDGHSGHDMRRKLEEMLDMAHSEKERTAIEEVLHKL